MLTTNEKIRILSGKGAWHNDDLDGKLPSIHLSDGPHGLRKQPEVNNGNNDSIPATCYPTASALACSWDMSAIDEMAESLGKEAWNMDVSVLLGPGTNMKRSPLCGRNFEYFSEDPYLAGQIATHFVNKVQEQGVATSLKHYCANSQETMRMTSNSVIDERTLREIYLSAFEMTVKNAQPATIMSSYNMVNGTHSTENGYLQNIILRDEWGFEGLVMSDWGACSDLAKSVHAGMDLEMPSSRGAHPEKMQKQFKAGLVEEKDIDVAVARVVALAEKYNPKGREKKPCNYHEAALSVAKRCAVLLKNDGVLPLDGITEVTVIGELARTMRFQGGGSSHINVPDYVNAIEALQKKGIKVNFASGYKVDSEEIDIQKELEAVELAKACSGDTPILFFGGLTDLAEGEGYDRTTLSMQDNQIHLFEKLYEVNPNMVFVSFSGAPYDIPFRDKVRAILHMYLCGEATGEAAVSIITGETNPSGKLAETFPVNIEDTPAFGNFGSRDKNIEYNEGVLVGYRHYDTNNVEPAYPFGYGLSYSTFEYSNISVEKTEESVPGAEGKKCIKYEVSLNVTNTGERDGYEAVQVYVENPKNQIAKEGFNGRPLKELKGFAKPFLKAGESKKITISLDERSFSIYDVVTRSFAVPEGTYKVLVGASSRDIRLDSVVEIKGGSQATQLTVISETAALESMKLRKYIVENGEEGDPIIDFDAVGSAPYTLSSSLSELSAASWLARKILKIGEETILKQHPGKPRNDPEILMYLDGMRDGTIDCVATNSDGALTHKMAEHIVKQANRHNIKKF